jgi:nitronate monooxygenase
MTRLTLQRLLGIDLPIVQAPMAGVQGSALAIAVSNAGGLGSLPCAMLAPDAMRDELVALTAGTSRPFNVNFFCHIEPATDVERETRWRSALAPYYEELGIDLNTNVPLPGRSAFNSDYADVLEPFKAWGSRIFSSATTLDEALWLEAHGVDVIVAQGLEAGGHRGMFLTDDLTTQIGTFALVPQIARAVRVPVVAAGGIADSKGAAAAMALGAAAAQVGTAYLLCPECVTHPMHRAALKSDAAHHTALTNVFTGRPARAIMNRIVREIGPMSKIAPEFPLATAAILPLRAAGRMDFLPMWSGQNASGCKEVPAAQLTQTLATAVSAR